MGGGGTKFNYSEELLILVVHTKQKVQGMMRQTILI